MVRKESVMGHMRSTRFYSELKDGSACSDLVSVDTEAGSFDMAYETFVALFGIDIQKQEEVSVIVHAKEIPDEQCKVPR